MSNTVTLLANQRAAPLPHTALRRVRHRLCSVYTLTCATARLATSERAGWERVSWCGPYAPLCLECTPVSRYLRACTRRWALWSRRRQAHNTVRRPSRSPLRQRPEPPAFSSTSCTRPPPSRPARDHLLRDLHGRSLFRNSEFYRRFMLYVYMSFSHCGSPCARARGRARRAAATSWSMLN